MEYLTAFRKNAIKISQQYPQEQFIIRSIYKVSACFQPHPIDLPYTDELIIVETQLPGCCYCFKENPVLPIEMIGVDARIVRTKSRSINIALLDSIYGSLVQQKPTSSYILDDSPAKKSVKRANIIVSEIAKIITQLQDIEEPHITVVGSVGSILYELSQHSDWIIHATDLDPSVVGEKFSGIVVDDGYKMTLSHLRNSHVALVTGMALTTNTLENIIKTAQECNVKIIMFTQTGGNFYEEYLRLGVEVIVSEVFPFYMFPGITKVNVFHNIKINAISH